MVEVLFVPVGEAEWRGLRRRLSGLRRVLPTPSDPDPALSGEQLLYRLFHEDGVRVFEPQPVNAHCTCSRPRILQVLQTFSSTEQADMVVDDRVTVTCEFCNRSYSFTPEELAGSPVAANDSGDDRDSGYIRDGWDDS